MLEQVREKVWWSYLDSEIQELFNESFLLLKNVPDWNVTFSDYSFIVFPAAKAYEGFLKKMFLDLGFISLNEYEGTRFRIGKALNPELERELRKEESIYDKLMNFCHSQELPNTLWDTWKECRNSIFHFFPHKKNAITYEESKEKILLIIHSIDSAFTSCNLS